MKLLLLITLLFSIVQSDEIERKLYDFYEQGDYKRACNYGIRKFNKFNNNEELISLYAFSCLKANFIDRLSIPISLLKKSADGRKNAAYLSIILMQKKLLYNALIDDIDLSSFVFPSTTNTLSKVFDLYSKKLYTKKNKIYYLNDIEKRDVHYQLFLKKSSNIYKINIQVYNGTKLVAEHTYR